MLRNKLVRSDGSIIDSSVIISCEFTEEVNSTTNLSVGGATASELNVEILATDIIQQDEVLTYYTIEDGVETKIGVFNAEKPTVATRTSMKFSAYDNIAKTEKLFSDWLRENQSLFPMALLALVEHACAHCGVTLATTDFPQAGLSVNAFYGDGITCRQILSWAAAIAGRFVRANVDGDLEFTWYVDSTNISVQPSKGAAPVAAAEAIANSGIILGDDGEGNISIESEDIVLTDDGQGNVAIASKMLAVTDDGRGNLVLSVKTGSAIPFRQGSLSYENYTTDLIQRVRINHSENDVGVIYPAEADGNCFTMSGNMILGMLETDTVSQIAESLYDQLKNVTYVPFSVTVPRTIQIRAGDTVVVTDLKGHTFSSYVMKVAVAPSGTTLSATGDKSYGSNVAVSSEKYANLTGKVLDISKNVDGLKIKNEDLTGKVSGLELSTETFKTYVENTFVTEDKFGQYRGEVSSTLEQTAENIDLRFKNVNQSIGDITAHVRTGVLDVDDEGSPIYGVEIGQRTEKDGAETFNKYARFSSDKLAFYDQSDNEVAYISDRKMYNTHVEVIGSYSQGGFVETTLADGSIVSRWVGGGT